MEQNNQPQFQNQGQPQQQIQQSQQSQKVIPRPPYQQMVLKRSMLPFLFSIISVNGMIVVFAVLVYGLIGMLIGFGFIFNPIILVLEIITILVILFFNYAYYVRYIETQYQVIPGYLHEVSHAITDQIPGKVEVTHGGLFDKESTVLRIDEFDRTGVRQSVVGRMFKYGNVLMQQIDELQETKDFVLTNVVSPYEATKIIQTMIDVEVNRAQPVQPIQGGN